MTLHERTAIREVLDAWDTPDSPELLTYAIYQLQRIYRNATTKPSPAKPTTMNAPTGIEAEVIKDIADRQRLGIAKYGCTVAESLDDMCQHAYEEALDLAIYLKAELIRRASDANYKHYTHHQND